MIDQDNGDLYLDDNAHVLIYPASFVKIMTLLLIFESLSEKSFSFDDEIGISSNMKSAWLLKKGETIRIRDAIAAIGIRSANEVARSLAVWHSGTEVSFVFEMNKKARLIGMHKTIFRNATGLHHAGQVSTAYDVALLTRFTVRKFPEYCGIMSAKSFTFRGIEFKNTNSLLGQRGVNGLKTGTTKEAGFCLIATWTKNEKAYISVIAGRNSRTQRDDDALNIIEKL